MVSLVIPPLTSEQLSRFWAKVNRSEFGCWEWTSCPNTSGYGNFFISMGPKARKVFLAHRVSWTLVKGPIPDGLEIDHLCRNRICVNPSHLEPVDHRTNGLRGFSSASLNYQKTHCPKGHSLVKVIRRQNGHQERRCYECQAEHHQSRSTQHRAYYLENREKIREQQRLYRLRGTHA